MYTDDNAYDILSLDDLKEYDVNFKNTPARVDEPGAGRPVDDIYLVKVENIFPTRSKSSNMPMVKWELTIVNGETTATKFRGRKLFRNNMFSSQSNIAWLKQDFLKAGVDVGEKATDLPEACQKIKGRYLKVAQKTNGENHNVYLKTLLTPEEAAKFVATLPVEESVSAGGSLGEFASLNTAQPVSGTDKATAPF